MIDSLEARLKNFKETVAATDTLKVAGRVSKVTGLVIESDGPRAPIGHLCKLVDNDGETLCHAEIVGFRDNKILSMVLGELHNVSPGTRIVTTGQSMQVPVGEGLLGRVLDGLGRPIDGKGSLYARGHRSIYSAPPNPLERTLITDQLETGIRVIDGLLPIGKGQRMGVFAGSGVGKSTLMGMIARQTEADVNVIALVGERGRELNEFIKNDLGEEGMQRSIVVVATSDQPALVRIKAAQVATSIAEYFREQGLDVMLMVDSVTRFAMAQREVGLAIGEPPATRGYTPSVFAMLPRLLERAGTSAKGSITGLYTVLVEGDDMQEPVADTVRGILDGHIVLSRALAERGHYPAVQLLDSISRLTPAITTPEHRQHMVRVRELLSALRENEDLISIGAYEPGTNPVIDLALRQQPHLMAYLRQDIDEHSNLQEAIQVLPHLYN